MKSRSKPSYTISFTLSTTYFIESFSYSPSDAMIKKESPALSFIWSTSGIAVKDGLYLVSPIDLETANSPFTRYLDPWKNTYPCWREVILQYSSSLPGECGLNISTPWPFQIMTADESPVAPIVRQFPLMSAMSAVVPTDVCCLPTEFENSSSSLLKALKRFDKSWF